MHSLLVLIAAQVIAGRHIVNMDEGWSFARVPQAPSIWRGRDAVSTTPWRTIKVSSEETSAEAAEAAKAFDGDPMTFWHTEWSKRQAPYPHELQIDLGIPVEVSGLRILPRQTPPQNGRPGHYRLYLTTNLQDWGKAVSEGDVPDSPQLFLAKFAPVRARYMKLVVSGGHREAEPFLALAEIGLVRNLDLSKQKDWASQYSVSSVEIGAKSDGLSKEKLESLQSAELKSIPASRWKSATLPHAAWIRPLNKPEIWQGVTYYRRRFAVSSLERSRHIELSIDGAMQASDLWLNGKWVGAKKGGYLPAIVDLTGKVRAVNDLLIRVDNSDNPLIPPGKPQAQLDFMYGAGVTRHATLTTTNRTYITIPLNDGRPYGGGVYVTYPAVGLQLANVLVRTDLRNDSGESQRLMVKQTLLDGQGQVVASAKEPSALSPRSGRTATQRLLVRRPALWSPASPNLYTLRTELVDRRGIVDQVTTRIGIRKIEVSRQAGFVLNGKSLRLIGTNRHQDYPWVGPALSDSANRRDALMIKRSGHNIVRLSHYPQSPAFLDACDELGILVIPCIPGWQFVNRDPRFEERVRQDIRNLIRRDRNHPSVAFWEASLNETYPGKEIAKDWNDTAKAEGLEGSVITAGDGTAGAPWDIIYNGWKEDLSRPQDSALERPGYIREYGDYEFGGAYSTSRVRIGQGMDKLLLETWNHVWSYNRFRTQYPWTMGAGTWEMFDHNVPWEFSISASGLADIFRREKPSFWFYESQESPKPFLRIGATWQPGAKMHDIVVFANCASARLYVNGKLEGTAVATRGRSTPYADAHRFDGTNTENLPHPPLVFRDVPFSAGELKVIGSNGASDSVRTAGKPDHLKVWVDDLGVPVTGNDLVFVRAAVVDAAGQVCMDDSRKVTFSVEGAAFAGELSAPCEMGVASVLVRTPPVKRPFTVRAATKDLKAGSTRG